MDYEKRYIRYLLMGIIQIIAIFMFLFPQIKSYATDNNIKTFIDLIFILVTGLQIYGIARRMYA